MEWWRTILHKLVVWYLVRDITLLIYNLSFFQLLTVDLLKSLKMGESILLKELLLAQKHCTSAAKAMFYWVQNFVPVKGMDSGFQVLPSVYVSD